MAYFMFHSIRSHKKDLMSRMAQYFFPSYLYSHYNAFKISSKEKHLCVPQAQLKNAFETVLHPPNLSSLKQDVYKAFFPWITQDYLTLSYWVQLLPTENRTEANDSKLRHMITPAKENNDHFYLLKGTVSGTSRPLETYFIFSEKNKSYTHCGHHGLWPPPYLK